jgi:hypothetical protein
MTVSAVREWLPALSVDHIALCRSAVDGRDDRIAADVIQPTAGSARGLLRHTGGRAVRKGHSMTDPHIHVSRDLGADLTTRSVLASTFGLVGDLPSVVTTGCGLDVPRAMTSHLPARVTCLPCREHAHQQYLLYAEQVSQLADMPGSPVSGEQAHAAAEQYRSLAAKFAT